MISVPEKQQGTTRRGFVKELTGNAAGLALAGILAAAFRPLQESIAQEIGGPGASASRAPGSKYRKCFLSELTAEEKEVGYGAMKMFTAFADDDIIEGCNYFSVMWMGESATKIMGHGPHTHPVAEVLVALGADPGNPMDLGATFEMYMGEEMEKHVIDRSTLIYVPPETVHCPFTIIKCTRPFIFIQAHYGPKLVETPRQDLVPAEMRDKYIFIKSDGKSEKKPKR
ncbi:MAG: hypothetical protein GXY47_00040 [Acidobacteria bacterium]|nr:hypothetical protein [Acidobacteriota bacterium]